MIPEYTKKGARLPLGGPDRVRMCMWYAEALDKGLSHEDAVEAARSLLKLLHWYAAAGIAKNLGTIVGGVPVEYLGEEMRAP